jgi:hypothetical protein
MFLLIDRFLFRSIVIMPEEPIPSYTIKDVWAHNVEEEFRSIRKIILKYPFVAMVSMNFDGSSGKMS